MPLAARMLSLKRSWHMRPQKRLNVRGMRTCGFTAMRTPRSVRTNTRRSPALLSGLSSRMSMHWWRMSGRASAGSRPCLRRNPAWSSQLSSTCSLLTLPVSRQARSSTTITLGSRATRPSEGTCDSASAGARTAVSLFLFLSMFLKDRRPCLAQSGIPRQPRAPDYLTHDSNTVAGGCDS